MEGRAGSVRRVSEIGRETWMMDIEEKSEKRVCRVPQGSEEDENGAMDAGDMTCVR